MYHADLLCVYDSTDVATPVHTLAGDARLLLREGSSTNSLSISMACTTVLLPIAGLRRDETYRVGQRRQRSAVDQGGVSGVDTNVISIPPFPMCFSMYQH
jgi:hypothetical protein